MPKVALSSENVCRLKVLLCPRARVSALVGWQGEYIKIKIAAPPVDGAANVALLKFLAGILGLKVNSLSLVSGQTGRRKLVKIEGLSEAELWVLLKNFK